MSNHNKIKYVFISSIHKNKVILLKHFGKFAELVLGIVNANAQREFI